MQCNCTAGYFGEFCQIKAKSCLDHFKYNRSAVPGNYDIRNDNGVAFTVFCDFDKSEKFAWTLVMSYTLANNDQLKTHPLYKDHPVAENLPNWAAYRLSKARMLSIHSQSSHWRATSNYNSDGVVLIDYVRSSFTNVDPLAKNGNGCKMMEYVNIRGTGCSDCTIWCNQEDKITFRLGNWYGEFNTDDEKCSFVNAAKLLNMNTVSVITPAPTKAIAAFLASPPQLNTGLVPLSFNLLKDIPVTGEVQQQNPHQGK